MKNIASTNNVKRGQKTINSEKVGNGWRFYPNLLFEGGQKNFIFYLRGVKNFELAFRGGSTFLSRKFEFDHPPLLLGYKWPTLKSIVIHNDTIETQVNVNKG